MLSSCVSGENKDGSVDIKNVSVSVKSFSINKLLNIVFYPPKMNSEEPNCV